MNKNKIFPTEIVEFTVENYFARKHTTSKVIYLTVVLGILLVLFSLPVIEVDVTTQSRGILRSSNENNKLFSAVYAEVVNADLYENKQVKKGDTLLVLKTDKIDEQVKITQLKVKENKQLISDLVKLVSGQYNRLATNTYQGEYLAYQQRYKGKELVVTHLRKEFELDEKLFNQKIIPPFEFEKKKNSFELALSELNLIKEQQMSQWQTKLMQLEMENKELLSKIKQFDKEKEQYIITAPLSGTIIQYSGIQAGNYIVPNQSVAHISPSENLLVECFVQPKDIGLINIGMQANFQFDAFNYNQWGSADGEVVEISEDIINMNDVPMFKVRCNISKDHLQLKNGYKGKLKKGMTLTGRFILIRRSLFDLLYDKADNWLNPKVKMPA